MMAKNFAPLFKYSKAGATQRWEIMAGENPDGTAYYSASYGLVDGAVQTSRVEVNCGKNIGKSNETSPFQQAISEAESKWNGQLDKGYSPKGPEKLATTSPMLAKSYDKEMAKVTFPCYYQPKLDGIRCIAHRQGDNIIMLSRKGKVFDTLEHITDVLINLMDDGEILDGELYVHGKPFQSIISWVKRKQADTSQVVYNVYDMVSPLPFKDRFSRICKIVGKQGQGVVRTVYTSLVDGHKAIAATLAEQEKRGYEGIMLRLGDCPYECGRRSGNLLKVKTFLDEEFEIVGAEENKGRQKGQCTFVCKTSTGATFKVKPMGTEEERQKMWKDSAGLIGSLLTVRFFEWTTSTPPVPRFPIGVAIRNYE